MENALKTFLRNEIKKTLLEYQEKNSSDDIQKQANTINLFLKKVNSVADWADRDDALDTLATAYVKTLKSLNSKGEKILDNRVQNLLKNEFDSFIDKVGALLDKPTKEKPNKVKKEPSEKKLKNTVSLPKKDSKSEIPKKEKELKQGTIIWFKKINGDDTYKSGTISRVDKYRDGSFQLNIDDGKYKIMSKDIGKSWEVTTIPKTKSENIKEMRLTGTTIFTVNTKDGKTEVEIKVTEIQPSKKDGEKFIQVYKRVGDREEWEKVTWDSVKKLVKEPKRIEIEKYIKDGE